MTKEEFISKIGQINSIRDSAIDKVSYEYAMSNNIFKKGDVIEDHIGSIIIDSIQWTKGKDLPYCIYFGRVLTKSGKLTKRPHTRNVWPSNITKATWDTFKKT